MVYVGREIEIAKDAFEMTLGAKMEKEVAEIDNGKDKESPDAPNLFEMTKQDTLKFIRYGYEELIQHS